MAKESFYKCFSSIILKEIGICFSEKKESGRPEVNSRPVAVFPARLARAGGPPSRPARGAAQGHGPAPARRGARRRRSRARRRGGGYGRPAGSGRERAGQRAHANHGEVTNPFLEKRGTRR
jgi:hypothetical protein